MQLQSFPNYQMQHDVSERIGLAEAWVHIYFFQITFQVREHKIGRFAA